MELNRLQPKEIQVAQGWVSHRRHMGPGRAKRLFQNGFSYSTFNFLIPVDSDQIVEELSRGRVFAIDPDSYLDFDKAGAEKGASQGQTLSQRVRFFLQSRCGYEPDEIWLQTLPSIFGYVFNPVSFWLCYRQERLDAVLVEVNNTFGDRHFYFVRPSTSDSCLPKDMHVSPFFSMGGQYLFNFDVSATKSDIQIHLVENGQKKLEARLCLEQLSPFKKMSAASLLARYGWMTALVMMRIHWQALIIWFKGAKYFARPEPSKRKVTL